MKSYYELTYQQSLERFDQEIKKAKNPLTDPEELIELAGSEMPSIRYHVSTNPYAPLESLVKLSEITIDECYPEDVIPALDHPNMTPYFRRYLQAKLYMTHYGL